MNCGTTRDPSLLAVGATDSEDEEYLLGWTFNTSVEPLVITPIRGVAMLRFRPSFCGVFSQTMPPVSMAWYRGTFETSPQIQ